MRDRKEHNFVPESEDFIDVALAYALRKAFGDFNFRTLTARKSDSNSENKTGFDAWLEKQKEKKENAKTKAEKNLIPTGRTDYLMEKLKEEGFYKRFVEYFKPDSIHKTEYGFDDWHHETCVLFFNTLKDDYENLCYGKAQKIVNMMFKHLYCLDGAEKYDRDGYFKYCHLILDSFTLEWFKRNVVEGGKVGVWSNLQYDTAENEYDNYTYYVSKVKEHFNKNSINGLTPFQFEFYMWPDMQVQMAAEAFYFSMKDNLSDGERREFRQKNTAMKAKDILESIEIYLK
jgi:hypothetical protein